MRFTVLRRLVLACTLAFSTNSLGEAPKVINHQGFITVGESNAPMSGPGAFKFGILDSGGNYLWTNDGSKVGEAATEAPSNAVSLEVKNGLYSLGLGDSELENMTPISPEVITGSGELKLRIYFDDGTNGEQQLSPDRPLSSVPYAYHANTADVAETAQSAVTAGRAETATRADTAGRADIADRAEVTDYADEAGNAQTAVTADRADVASVATVVRGNFAGGIIGSETGNATKSLSINRLDCLDDSLTHVISTTSTMRKFANANFAVGNNVGGLEPGVTLAGELFLRVFAIGSSTDPSKVDFLFTNKEAPDYPSGFNTRRFLGSRLWLGGSTGQFARYKEVYNGRNRKVVYMTPRAPTAGQTLNANVFTKVDVKLHVPSSAREIELLAVATRPDNGEGSDVINIYVRPAPAIEAVGTAVSDATLFGTGVGTRAMGAGTVPVEQSFGAPVEFEYAVSPGASVAFYVRSYTESL